MTVAFCAESLKRSAAVTAGVQPITSPPMVMPAFQSALLEGNALLFLKLHGAPGQPYWYGDGGVTACSAEQIASARLNGAMVFAANCWGGKDAPMVQALLAAGAACVVTGEGVNYAGVARIDGADVIGFIWRQLLELGLNAGAAFAAGQVAAKLRRPALAADIDSFSLVGAHDARLKEMPHAS